jgi:tRNA threonylcarbamoyladenosine biosynthesis protein TsaB
VKLLAIDSATERLALAAVDDGRSAPGDPLVRERCRVAAAEVEGGATSSSLAIPGLMRLLDAQGWTFADLDAVAFGRGPGAFTGLRTACAVAQGLAYGQDIPVVPVDSLALVAEDAAAQLGAAASAGRPVWVAMDARMDEIYAARYERDFRGGWRATDAPRLVSVEALADEWRTSPPAIVAGSALPAFGQRLDAGAALHVPREADRAGTLAWLAACGLARGDAVPPRAALPVYVRDKVALTTAEREARRG